MKRTILLLTALAAVPAFAQTTAPAATTVPGTPESVPTAAPAAAAPAPIQLVLPANTEVAVTPTSDLSSKGIKEGHIVPLTTVFDVMLNGYVVIPKGTPGQGTVAWRTGKGAFGKSAKMDLRFDWLELNGRRIGLVGTHRQAGEGNTGAAVGAVVAVGVFGAFVTGKSAKIPNGMQLSARTSEALPVVLPANSVPVPTATLAPATTGSPTGN